MDEFASCNSLILLLSNSITNYFAQIKKKQAFLIVFSNINLCF